ncbi:hypothetical protein ACFL34_05655 [Candidatus Sumerlaeota bacterium]
MATLITDLLSEGSSGEFPLLTRLIVDAYAQRRKGMAKAQIRFVHTTYIVHYAVQPPMELSATNASGTFDDILWQDSQPIRFVPALPQLESHSTYIHIDDASIVLPQFETRCLIAAQEEGASDTNYVGEVRLFFEYSRGKWNLVKSNCRTIASVGITE